MANFYDRKVKEAQDQGKVWACPICGTEVLNSCYHDGVDYNSKLLTEEEADTLRQNDSSVEDEVRRLSQQLKFAEGFLPPYVWDAYRKRLEKEGLK